MTVTAREYVMGRFRLRPDRELLLDGERIGLSNKPLKILSALVEASGDLVTKDELIELIWPGLVIEENALQAHISTIRKALKEDGRWVAAVPGRGYRYVGPCSPSGLGNDSPIVPLPSVASLEPVPVVPRAPAVSRRSRLARAWLLSAVLVVLAIAVGLAIQFAAAPPPTSVVTRYFVPDFQNKTGDARYGATLAVLPGLVAARIENHFWDSVIVRPDEMGIGKNAAKGGKERPPSTDYIVQGSLGPGDRGVVVELAAVDAASGAEVAQVASEVTPDELARTSFLVGLSDKLRWAIVREEGKRAIEAPNDNDPRNLLRRAERIVDEQATREPLLQAIAMADRAATLAPRNVHALYGAGYTRVAMITSFAYRTVAERVALLDQAETALSAAERLAPARAAIHITLADLRDNQGRHEAARSEFQRALELDPQNAYALDGLAMEDVYLGEPRRAAEKLDRARELDPEDAYMIDGDLAVMHLDLGEDDAALADLRHALAVDASDPWSWLFEAALLRRTGHDEEARAAIESARRLNPDLKLWMLRLGDANADAHYRDSQERLYADLRALGMPDDAAP